MYPGQAAQLLRGQPPEEIRLPCAIVTKNHGPVTQVTLLRPNDKTAPLSMTEALTEIMAAPQGFEPRYYGPEPHVLPLDEGAAKPKSLVGPLQ